MIFEQLFATVHIWIFLNVLQKPTQEILVNLHDAMKYIHDQTVRKMENSDNYDEIVSSVKLPKHLAESPWLVQTYGKVEWAVKGKFHMHSIVWLDPSQYLFIILKHRIKFDILK